MSRFVAFLLVVAATSALAAEPVVRQSAREIPVAYRVDVVVVGGSTGAVSAAVAAAEKGAKVFLLAAEPYLGEDMAASLRLWLEPGETPRAELARRIFSDVLEPDFQPDPNRLPFTYTADLPSQASHRDSDPPGVLTDGKWGSPNHESVQYGGDVQITADLGRARQVEKVRVAVYQRMGGPKGNGFKVQRVQISASDDGRNWRSVGEVVNDRAVEPTDAGTDRCLVLKAPAKGEARYWKFTVIKDPAERRVLLGEVEIIGPAEKPDLPAGPRPVRPMHLKKVLDDALLDAGIPFLYNCYPTDLVRDARGMPCGVVMANRAGRQAVLAKTIIDATPRGLVARLAGASFRPYPAGEHVFQRVVIGGPAQKVKGGSVRTIPIAFRGPFPNAAKTSSGEFPIHEYTLRLPMAGAGTADWAAADQKARTLTWHPEQQFTSSRLFEVPPDAVISEGRHAEAKEDPLLAAARPKGVARVWVLGGCADVSRAAAAALVRPLALIDFGRRVGEAAAEEAAGLTPPQVPTVSCGTVTPPTRGDVKEFLSGVRPAQKPQTIPQQAGGLAVLGRYDVVVIGGGTSGAPAGIAAARQGAKTLVIEQQSGLGGVGTLGAISKYYWGNRVGFTASIPTGNSWVIEEKMEWYRQELLKAKAEVWFGAIGCGAVVQEQQVRGVVVATPEGRGAVLAKVVIDATGNADIAAAAGATCVYTDQNELAMQGTGLPPRQLGASYANTDYTITDETDLVDTWQLLVYAKDKFRTAFDLGTFIDTRERRRIVGDFTLSLVDLVNRRTHPDTVFVAYSNFDTHGYTVDPYLMIEHPETRGVRVNVPYRCMLPQGLEGLLVGGLGMSAHRDALPLVRMQPDLQNQGYALGVAAATAAKNETLLRHIDLRALQRHLVEMGNLPESVLTEEDSYPLPLEKVQEAVASLPKQGSGAAVVLAHRQVALPLLREAYRKAEAGPARLTYALVLGLLDDATGAATLREAVEAAPAWDTGWRYRGGGQFGEALSPLDKQIIALGRTRAPGALQAIVAKVRLLDATSEFSHHRAVALALETLADPAAAAPLAELLGKDGMAGHVHSDIETARKRNGPGVHPNQTRDESIRELDLARALYRCGDYQGLGVKTLRAYAEDLRGHYARHARAVIEKR